MAKANSDDEIEVSSKNFQKVTESLEKVGFLNYLQQQKFCFDSMS
jgi:hypothetical protein